MEDYLKDISNQSEFIDDATSAIIKVIGVGGGGDNAVNYMYRQNIPNVNFVVCNTDEQALRMSPVPDQLILGWDVTHGRGAGNDPSTEECVRNLLLKTFAPFSTSTPRWCSSPPEWAVAPGPAQHPS